jgi:hypothetical protein
MDPEDLFENEELLANLDVTFLDIQKDLVRIIVLVNSVLLLQGLTFLFLAWVVDSFLATVVIGLICSRIGGWVATTVGDFRVERAS